jgi:hypothetical protein
MWCRSEHDDAAIGLLREFAQELEAPVPALTA